MKPNVLLTIVLSSVVPGLCVRAHGEQPRSPLQAEKAAYAPGTERKEQAIASALQLRNKGDAEGALTILQQASAAMPKDTELLLDIGIQAQSMQRLRVAETALRNLLTLDPTHERGIYALARVEMDEGKLPDAEMHFNLYLKRSPTDATAIYGLGRVYQLQQKSEQAAVEFHRSITLKPVQTESYYQLGQMALEAHRDEEAKQMFLKTLERMPEHGGALTGVGILAYRAKNYSEAQTAFAKATINSPEYQPAHYYLGLVLARLGNKQASQLELDKAAALTEAQQGKGKPITEQ